MGRKPIQPPPETPTRLVISRQEAAQKLNDRLVAGRELKGLTIQDGSALDAATKAYWTWDEFNEEMLRQMFTTPKLADEYRSFGGYGGVDDGYLSEDIVRYGEMVSDKLRRLESIKGRLELFAPLPATSAGGPSAALGHAETNQRVFVVHGHDEAVRESVARFLDRLGLKPVILHEQASGGKTLSEKLEQHGDVGFAVVLLTPDDVGGKDEKNLRSRARQNVLLELGYFVGRLGRARVCALYKGDLELPSDFVGVAYVAWDTSSGWQLKVAKELRDAGFAIDLNKVL